MFYKIIHIKCYVDHILYILSASELKQESTSLLKLSTHNSSYFMYYELFCLRDAKLKTLMF